MSQDIGREPMLDMFLFESMQLLEQLEQILINCEKAGSFDDAINDIFRIMHTIKGSSAMMMFNGISRLSHSMEDIFYHLREKKPKKLKYTELLDLVLEGVDFIKSEVAQIESGREADRDAGPLIARMQAFLTDLKQASGEVPEVVPAQPEAAKFYIASAPGTVAEEPGRIKYRVTVFFDEGCDMENIRAFGIVHALKDNFTVLTQVPEDVVGDETASETIRRDGFLLVISTERNPEEFSEVIHQSLFIRDLVVEEITQSATEWVPQPAKAVAVPEQRAAEASEQPLEQSSVREPDIHAETPAASVSTKQSLISVQLTKLDVLLDLVGEIVISEAMVTRHPELEGLELENFHKAARQLRKLTHELQDVVMSIRMIPLASTFQKMHRLVRDMSRKLHKEVDLKLIGEETEVDKNIIENLSDPLMHLVRNAIDHGIEMPEDRVKKGKPAKGTITLEAKNAGGDVWILIKDDGKGLDRNRILEKAREQGLVGRNDTELTDRDVYSFILLPGFSTKEQVTEFSGRGVGMDVVQQNIQKIGGSIQIDSVQDQGTTFSIRIPLTLAIIDGMEVSVGNSKFTLPITAIKESFRATEQHVICDPDGTEMVMVRGTCYPVVKLFERYRLRTGVTELTEGIVLMVDNGGKAGCLFADALLGEQQVVVKPLPKYLKNISGISGCSIMGDGSISLILDVDALMS